MHLYMTYIQALLSLKSVVLMVLSSCLRCGVTTEGEGGGVVGVLQRINGGAEQTEGNLAYVLNVSHWLRKR